MDVTFSQWTERLRAQADYLKALGEFKVKLAEAQLKNAEESNQRTLALARQVLIVQLQKDLRALERASESTRKEIERREARARAVRKLLRGRRISPAEFSSARGNFAMLISQAVLETGDALYQVAVGDAERAATNFVSIRDTREPATAPADCDNAVELLYWTLERTQEYIARGGSDAQRAILKVCLAIDDTAAAYIAAAASARDAMKKNVYDAWKFDAMLAAGAKGAGANIVTAGTKN